MTETQTRYTRKKKKKTKRFGFGISLWDPKETKSPHPEQQQRLLRPRAPVATPTVAPTRLRRGYLSLTPEDRRLIEQVRDFAKRSLGDDSERLDALVSHLANIGLAAEWVDETEMIPGHWRVEHISESVSAEAGDYGDQSEDVEEEEDAPVVRTEPPQESVDDTA